MRSMWQWVLLAAAVCGVTATIYMGESSRQAQAVRDDWLGPEAAVTSMVLAQRDGDVNMFLNCLDNPELAEVESAINVRSRAAVSGDLKSGLDGLQGYAVTRQNEGAVQSSSAQVQLELIFPNRTVTLMINLRQVDQVWKVTQRVETSTPDVPSPSPDATSLLTTEQHSAQLTR